MQDHWWLGVANSAAIPAGLIGMVAACALAELGRSLLSLVSSLIMTVTSVRYFWLAALPVLPASEPRLATQDDEASCFLHDGA